MPLNAHAGEQPPRHLFYESFDLSFDGIHLSEGYDYTLPGPGQLGDLMFRVNLSEGVGFYASSASASGLARTQTLGARVATGFKREFGKAEWTLLIGADLTERKALPFDADPATGLRIGPTIIGKVWWQANDLTVLKFEGHYSTAFNSFNTTIAAGLVLAEGLTFGPELGASGHDGSKRLKAGFHFTGLQFGIFHLRFQAGYARNDNGTQGPYGAVSSWQKF